MAIGYVRELVGPTVEPVTLEEARLWCRDPAVEDDAMLLLLIQEAREHAEEITGRAFAQRQLELRLDEFPASGAAIELPFPPLVSVQYLTYATDDGDVSLGGSPDAFLVDTGAVPGRIQTLDGTAWPTSKAQIGAIRVGYTSGYANTNAIPKAVRIYMQARISTLFEQREQIAMGMNITPLPRDFAEGLLDGLRAKRMFA